MATKPVPALGFVIGVIATYAGVVAASYATLRLIQRVMVFQNNLGRSLPWLALLLAVAVVLGVLMMVPAIGSGVTTGAGALLTVVGLAVLVLPVRQAYDLSKLFQLPGTRYNGGSYLLFDGSMVLFGVILLLVGIRRWAVDAKVHKLLQAQGQGQGGQGQFQDNRGYQSTFPTQQPQQYGGYPGQQQQHPGQQQPSGQQSPYQGGQQPPR